MDEIVFYQYNLINSSINLEHLSEGVYFFSFQTMNEFHTVKIVKIGE
jgi:hypothetical protein